MPQSDIEEVQVDRHVMYRLERKRSWVGATTFEVTSVGEDREDDTDFLSSTQTIELTAKDIPRIVRENIRGSGGSGEVAGRLPRKLRNVPSVPSNLA